MSPTVPLSVGGILTPQHMVSRAHRSPCTPHPERHLDRFIHFCQAYRWWSLYFLMGRQMCPKLPLPVGNSDRTPTSYIVHFTGGPRPNPHPKLHLDLFRGHFCKAPDCVQQTDRPLNVCNNRPHCRRPPCIACLKDSLLTGTVCIEQGR